MKPKVKFTIITLFPEALQPYLESSMLYKAQKNGIIAIDYVNLRNFGIGAHKSVDDTPYGGGDGMLLRCEPAFAAIESIKAQDPEAKVILPTPVGEVWNQELARKFANIPNPTVMTAGSDKYSFSEASTTNGEWPEQGAPVTTGRAVASSEKSDYRELSAHYIIFCPHYEGYDERIMSLVDYPISLGNYVLTGGELPALIIIDSITRLLPGVLGGETSAEIESFSDGDNLEYPQYTKPADFRGMKVPEILLSGHHAKIAEWRAEQSKQRERARGSKLVYGWYNSMDKDYYRSLYEWYEDKAEPQMKKLDQIFSKEVKGNRTDEFIFNWWGEFRKNVMSLFEATRYKNPSYQLAMTMRWLMEAAASMAFIRKYPENISELEKWFFDIYNIEPKPTRYEIAERANKQSLYRYENGKKNKQPTGQTGRLKDVFTTKDMKHYCFLNMFAHFDLTGIVWDLKVHCSTDQERYNENLAIISLLSKTINITVASLAKIYGIPELKDFDFDVAISSQLSVGSMCRLK